MKVLRNITLLFVISAIICSCTVTTHVSDDYYDRTKIVCPMCHGSGFTYQVDYTRYHPNTVYLKVVCTWCYGLGYTPRYYVPNRIRVAQPRPRVHKPIRPQRPQPRPNHRDNHSFGKRR